MFSLNESRIAEIDGAPPIGIVYPVTTTELTPTRLQVAGGVATGHHSVEIIEEQCLARNCLQSAGEAFFQHLCSARIHGLQCKVLLSVSGALAIDRLAMMLGFPQRDDVCCDLLEFAQRPPTSLGPAIRAPDRLFQIRDHHAVQIKELLRSRAGGLAW